MPRRHCTPQELQERRALATQWGNIIARRAFGDDGPGLGLDLDTREQVAQAAAAGLNEGTLPILLQRQAAARGERQPCPQCGRPGAVRRAQRPPHVRGAQLRQSEPVGHCPDCRRDLFPPAAAAAPGRARLQPRALADDRHRRRPLALLRRRRLRPGPFRPVDLRPPRPAADAGGRHRPGAGARRAGPTALAPAAAARVRAAAARPAPGAAAGRPGRRPARRGPAAGGAGSGRGRGGAGRPGPAGGAGGPPAAGADVCGRQGQQPVVRAAGGGGAQPGLLRGAAAGARGRRLRVQPVDPPRLLRGLRADRGPAARGRLPVPGGARGRGRGRALAAVPAPAALLLAGARGRGRGAAGASPGGVGVPAAGGGAAGDRSARAAGGGAVVRRSNAGRRDYPRYRREGLPTTSSLAESLGGAFNARVKGKQKFWNRPGGAAAVPQVRAALLREDGRRERYFAERPGSPSRRRATGAPASITEQCMTSRITAGWCPAIALQAGPQARIPPTPDGKSSEVRVVSDCER